MPRLSVSAWDMVIVAFLNTGRFRSFILKGSLPSGAMSPGIMPAPVS